MTHLFKKNSGTAKRFVPSAAQALDLATDGLLYILQQPDQISELMARSGLGPGDLRARATDKDFLVFVLDYIASDESLLLSFAANRHHAPETVAAAAHVLSGLPPQ